MDVVAGDAVDRLGPGPATANALDRPAAAAGVASGSQVHSLARVDGASAASLLAAAEFAGFADDKSTDRTIPATAEIAGDSSFAVPHSAAARWAGNARACSFAGARFARYATGF